MSRHHHKHIHGRDISLKWSILWVLIHAAALLLIGLILAALNIGQSLVYLLLTGFGITTIAGLVRIYTRRRRFIVDEIFFFWCIINTFVIWIAWLILNALDIQNVLFRLPIIGLFLVFISHTVMVIRPSRNQRVFTAIILLLLIFFFNLRV